MKTSHFICIFLIALSVYACPKSNGPKTNSQTHWLSCGAGEQCVGEDEVCVCGICSTICSTDADCTDRDGICIDAMDTTTDHAGVVSGADGCVRSSLSKILYGVEDVELKACLPKCDRDTDCGSTHFCDLGVCVPGVGAPCLPEIVPSAEVNGLTVKGFSETEVYIESSTPDCATGVCTVHHLEGDPSLECDENCADPQELPLKAHCTCRCDGPASNPSEDFCQCPDGFSCIELIETGSFQGSYCINDETFFYEASRIHFR